MKTFVAFCCMFGVALALPEIVSDEPTPSRVADVATLAARVSELERRVQALETPTVAEPAAVAESLPVLEIHSETWCGPCQTLNAHAKLNRATSPLTVIQSVMRNTPRLA